MNYADNLCTYTEDKRGYIYKGPCIKCKKTITVIIPPPELYAYRQGAKLQHAMPSLSNGEREFLNSGICTECWDKIFNQKEE